MRVLDLFCGAGGAAMGYHQAWPDAEIIGVDLKPQPRYPFSFVQADALTFALEGFDFIHASPPCQRFSTMTGRWGRSGDHPDLIGVIRDRLAGRPAWVIENVPGAGLRDPATLCGSMFGLGVRRHRDFEASFLIPTAVCDHSRRAIGVYGHSGGKSTRDGLAFPRVAEWRLAMGIDWMTRDELAQAIPPAYTRHIAESLPRG